MSLEREVEPPCRRRRDPRLAIATVAAVLASVIAVAQRFELAERSLQHRREVERMERVITDELRALGLTPTWVPIHCTSGSRWRTDGAHHWCQR
jgi:hypothetical protein